MKKLLCIALCAVLALALTIPAAAAYSDVAEDAWYAAAVDWCAAQGLMNGPGDGRFDPDGPVTRGTLVTTLWRMAGKPPVGTSSGFTDVAEGMWYDVPVRWAYRVGVTDGMGDGTFAPDAPLSRAQLVTFFHRFASLPTALGEDFADQADIPDWAQAAAKWARGAGVVQGKGENAFDPLSGATRAELAQVLQNYAEKVGTTPKLREALDASVSPVGVGFAANGAALITDGFNKAIWSVTADGAERIAGAVTVGGTDSAAIGGYLDGAANEALFASPWGIAPFLGGWAISDTDNHCVRLLRGGSVMTLNGIDLDGPTGLAAGADGCLYVADTPAGTVVRVSAKGEAETVAEGLDGPTGLAWYAGVLYIAETDANRIVTLGADGTVMAFAGSGESGLLDGAAAEARFTGPQGLTVGPDGTVYVGDTANAAVRRIRDGAVTTLLTPPDGFDLQTWPASPVGLALRGGVLTVCDRFACKLIEVPVT